MKFIYNQKPFDQLNDAIFDPFGKTVLKEILTAMHYTEIVTRENEISDEDPTFWDMRGVKNDKIIYFDVSVKNPWKVGHCCPFLKDGIDIVCRKSINHNSRHSRVNYYVEVSKDGCGAFFVSKEMFEKSPIINKLCKNFLTGEKFYDNVKRIQVKDGLIIVKKDGKWQKQS